jgi:hypothetical protein
MAGDKGLQFLAVIDQSEQARRIGRELRSATLVMSLQPRGRGADDGCRAAGGACRPAQPPVELAKILARIDDLPDGLVAGERLSPTAQTPGRS